MPSFNITPELLACLVDAVVVFLVVQRSRYAVAKHAFRERRQVGDSILLEEPSGAG